MSKLRIRTAGRDDLDAIDAIEAASFDADRFPRRNLARLIGRTTAVFLLAEEGGAALGYVLLLFRTKAISARLYSLATTPSAREKGAAFELVRAAFQCAIERGAEKMRLETRQSNAPAIRLYERAGFKVLKVMPYYYDDGETALQMEARLYSHTDDKL